MTTMVVNSQGKEINIDDKNVDASELIEFVKECFELFWLMKLSIPGITISFDTVNIQFFNTQSYLTHNGRFASIRLLYPALIDSTTKQIITKGSYVTIPK